MDSSPSRLALKIGAFLGLLGVLLGAMGAHFIRPHLSEFSFDIFRTALLYQWFHALTLLALAQGNTLRRGPVICWTLGVFLFSGSLYVLALDKDLVYFGPLTPLGGVSLIVGWIWYLVNIFSKK